MNNNSIIGKELQLLLSYLYEQKHMVVIGQEKNFEVTQIEVFHYLEITTTVISVVV